MSASDTLRAVAGVGAVILGGIVVWKLSQGQQQQQQQQPLYLVPSAINRGASASVQGATQGYNYAISPASYSTEPGDVLALASATQGVISAGIGSVLAPVLAPINAIGGWLGSVL